MHSQQLKSIFWHLAGCIVINFAAFAATDTTASRTRSLWDYSPLQKPDAMKLLAGWNFYQMKDFNSYLDSFQVSPLKVGLNFALEGYYYPDENSSSKTGETVLGGELLLAGKYQVVDNTIIKWNLPIVGVYLGNQYPLITAEKWGYLKLRAHIGYYKMIRARLTVSDRPGYLKLEDDAIGVLASLNWNWNPVSIEVGWRILKFTSVLQRGIDGFSTVPGGPEIPYLPFPVDLDYSGLLIRIGFRLNLYVPPNPPH